MISPDVIEEVKNRLIKAYNPLEIYIFGSYAWGHPDDESDLGSLEFLNFDEAILWFQITSTHNNCTQNKNYKWRFFCHPRESGDPGSNCFF
jgi:predicted nucleotidyltransferase